MLARLARAFDPGIKTLPSVYVCSPPCSASAKLNWMVGLVWTSGWPNEDKRPLAAIFLKCDARHRLSPGEGELETLHIAYTGEAYAGITGKHRFVGGRSQRGGFNKGENS